jgi:hypothetical protein
MKIGLRKAQRTNMKKEVPSSTLSCGWCELSELEKTKSSIEPQVRVAVKA